MNILFIGSLRSEAHNKILEKANLPTSSAAQVFEKALLSGLDLQCDVHVISEFFAPSYPRLKKLIIWSETFSHKNVGNDEDVSISFINLPILKKMTQMLSYCREIRRQLKWADVIVVNEATSRQLLPPSLVARNKTKIAIIQDLPEYMSENRNPVYLFAKKIDRWLIDYALKRFDGFVLLSKYMKDRLKTSDKECLILEGIFNTQDCTDTVEKEPKKIVLYTGKIEKWFGLEDLLKAFCKVKGEDCRLWLCGSGDIDLVNTYSKLDDRIEYKGIFPHEEVLELQKKATLLVNPRHSDAEFTKYSFPSKTMEYMASGTPTLMCRLQSLPDEYVKHLYIFEDESVDGYARKMQECLELSDAERADFGKKASEFIINNKSSEKQGQRLFQYIKRINDEK